MNTNDENNAEKVIEFMSIASLEYDVAMMLMKEAGFNLDLAINNFFSALSAHETKPNTQPKKIVSHQDEDYVPSLESLPKPKIMRLVDNYYEDESVYRPTNIGSAFDQNVVEPFRDFKEEKMRDKKPGKADNLASLFRPPFEICFEENYEKAMEHGTKHHKYLIINIQDITVFDCQKLNRDTWSDATLKTYIKNNFIFWQRTKNMAAKFCQYYSPNILPHVSILDPRTGEKLDTWEGFMSAKEMLNNLKNFLRNHPFEPESIEINDGTLEQIKPKKPVTKHISDLTEEEQMEEIIKISLLESQENEENEKNEEMNKKEKKEKKENGKKDESNPLKRKEDAILIDDDSQPSRKKTKYIEIDEEENNNNIKSIKGPIVIEEDNLIFEISDEQFLTLSGDDDSFNGDHYNMDEENENKENIEIQNKIDENNIEENNIEENNTEEKKMEENIPEVNCTLKIRLPNGKFLSHCFLSTNSLLKVHQWIRQERTDIEDNKRKENHFNLVSGHPSKIYTEQDSENFTLHNAGLVPRGVIFVENA